MYKHLFRAVLGFVGLMGALAIGVVDAKTAVISDGIYSFVDENGENVKTVIYGDTQLTIQMGDLGYYYRGFNENTSNSVFDDYSNGIGTYMGDDGKMHGGTYGLNDARGGSGDNVSNGFDSGNERDKRQGPCSTGYHVPSRGERNNLIIAWCNIYTGCNARYSDIQVEGVSGDLIKVSNWSDSNNMIYIRRSPLGSNFKDTFNISSPSPRINTFYWSSSPYPDNESDAQYLGVWGDRIDPGNSYLRSDSRRVRCFKDFIAEPRTAYNITFVNEGRHIRNGKIRSGSMIPDAIIIRYNLTGLTKTGYNFSGWAISGSNERFDVENDTVITGMTLNAVRKIMNYKIDYELNGGINNENNTGVYTIEDIVTLGDPTKEGYIFDGWYSDADFITRIDSISKGSFGDKTLYAKRGGCNLGYTENSVGICEKIRVEFDANGGKFGNDDIKVVESEIKYNSDIKYSHTPNVDDEGNKISDYDNGLILNDVVTITGATNLHVKIKRSFLWSYYSHGVNIFGHVAMWEGNHPNYTVDGYSNVNTYGWSVGGNRLSEPIIILDGFHSSMSGTEYDIEGDTVTFASSTSDAWADYSMGGDAYGYYAIVEGTNTYVEYSGKAFDNIPEPSREGHKFVGWYLSDDTEFNTGSVSTGEVTYVHAKWECAQGYVDMQGQCVKEETRPSGGSSGGGGGGGGGGSSSSSCKNLPANAVANNSSTPSSNTNYYYSTNTSKVCTFQCKSGYTRNAEKETCDKASDTQTTTSGTNVKEPEGTGNNTKVKTGNNTEIQTGSKIDAPEQASQDDKQDTQDSTTKTPEGKTNSTTSSTYSPEFQEAYEFAHENGITTKNTIQSADMNGKLTRIAMAKMLSQYAINVLGKTPDTTQNNKFNDVTDKRDVDYDNGVTLAYQLGIMGQNMPGNKFRPDDEVTRAEFATALSRMLYNTSDGQYKSTDKYYTNHMSKLVKEGIITKDDPKMKELRGYVMIMLMRSAK